MNKLKKTLRLVIPLLNNGNYQYHITGGFAAHLYGSERPVNDIDLALPQQDFQRFSDELKRFVIDGPRRFTLAPWDLRLTELKIDDQLIDLSGDELARVLDKNTKSWVPISENFESAVKVEQFGLSLMVQNPIDLMSYKRIISWKGDELKHLADVEVMERWVRNNKKLYCD